MTFNVFFCVWTIKNGARLHTEKFVKQISCSEYPYLQMYDILIHVEWFVIIIWHPPIIKCDIRFHNYPI